MIAYIVNHRKTPNIIVTIIDMFSVGNSCMSIIGNLRYKYKDTQVARDYPEQSAAMYSNIL